MIRHTPVDTSSRILKARIAQHEHQHRMREQVWQEKPWVTRVAIRLLQASLIVGLPLAGLLVLLLLTGCELGRH